MYCPKCNENFEEGSRRFCPVDGSRLVSEAAVNSQGGGIFANLINKIEGVSELRDKTTRRLPERPTEIRDDTAFFEFEDSDTPDFLQPAATTPGTPVGRKVNSFEIPAGHVDITEGYQQPAFTSDFYSDDPESFVGRVVKGRYKVTEFLGGDENGLAYLADDKIVADRMVLVRILADYESDEIMDRILAEERVSLSHFTHPNVARVIDSGQFTGGTHFIVSEYVDALSVADILGIHGQFPPARAGRVIRQAASALGEAHQQGIIHRDIRPANLIIDASGEAEQVTVVNFGASTGDPTEQNFRYKAPEILDGRITTIASDTYSLAVVAFEMLTGRLPFEGETIKEMTRLQNEDFSLVGLPRGVAEVLSKALSMNAAERYPKTRDFGEAFGNSLADAEEQIAEAAPIVAPVEAVPAEKPIVQVPTSRSEILMPLVPPVATQPVAPMIEDVPPAAAVPVAEPAWKNRSPEPPQVAHSRATTVFAFGLLALLAFVALGWYFLARDTATLEANLAANQAAANAGPTPLGGDTEMPPFPRRIPQPPDTNFFQNSKTNLKGDLLRNFVGFTMYYPKSWKVNGPQVGSAPNLRGKFVDIAKFDPDGRLREQMLVSYYASKGTFSSDAENFPELVKETNETLKNLLPNYRMVSEGETKINGDWRAYEVKFEGGTADLKVYGRRIFMPAARPGVRNGFAITMLVTSLATEITGADDVGQKGELAQILYSFEPSQNF